jgi:hypothetical protein
MHSTGFIDIVTNSVMPKIEAKHGQTSEILTSSFRSSSSLQMDTTTSTKASPAQDVIEKTENR